MAHSPNASKYEELRGEFLQAAADFDQLTFRLRIERGESWEQQLIEGGRYHVPCYTEWPFGPWRRCAVLAPFRGEMEAPYSKLKALAANAWVWLPEHVREPVLIWIEHDAYLWRGYFEPWISLLWLRYFIENFREKMPPPGPAGVDMEPFGTSAGLIHDWGLNTDRPTVPDWLNRGARANQAKTQGPVTDDSEGTREVAAEQMNAAIQLLSVYTGGLSNARFEQAAAVLADDSLSGNDKIEKIDSLIPIPPDVSAEKLGKLVGVSKPAVINGKWWEKNRKGKKADEIARRESVHKARAKQHEPMKDDDE